MKRSDTVSNWLMCFSFDCRIPLWPLWLLLNGSDVPPLDADSVAIHKNGWRHRDRGLDVEAHFQNKLVCQSIIVLCRALTLFFLP